MPKRPTLAATLRGETLPLTEWAKKLGIPYRVLYFRVHRLHWDDETALTTPVKDRDGVYEAKGKWWIPLANATTRRCMGPCDTEDEALELREAILKLVDKGWLSYDQLQSKAAIEAGGRMMSATAWAKELGMKRDTLNYQAKKQNITPAELIRRIVGKDSAAETVAN